MILLRLLALAFVGWIGWYSHGVYVEAQQSDALKEAIKARDTAQKKADAKGKEAEESRQTADHNHFLLTQEIAKHAKKSPSAVCVGTPKTLGTAASSSAVDAPVPRLTDDFLCFYDAALFGADGSECQSEGSPARASDLEPGDILPIHAENARRWQDCRIRFNALIDSLQKQGEE